MQESTERCKKVLLFVSFWNKTSDERNYGSSAKKIDP